jgi:hypothetical protein
LRPDHPGVRDNPHRTVTNHLLVGRIDPAMEHFRWAKQYADRITIAYVISDDELDRLKAKANP